MGKERNLFFSFGGELGSISSKSTQKQFNAKHMIPILPPLDGVSSGVLGYFNRTKTIAGPRPIKGHDEGIQEIAIQGVMVPS